MTLYVTSDYAVCYAVVMCAGEKYARGTRPNKLSSENVFNVPHLASLLWFLCNVFLLACMQSCWGMPTK